MVISYWYMERQFSCVDLVLGSLTEYLIFHLQMRFRQSLSADNGFSSLLILTSIIIFLTLYWLKHQ